MGMASGAYSGRMRSHPVRVRFAGWESDTFTLQREGWEISADQDVRCDRMSIAIKHPKMGIGGVTSYADWQYQRYFGDARYADQLPPLPILEMRQLSGVHERVYFQHRRLELSTRAYSPIDAVPSYVVEEPKTLDDIAHFASFEQKRILLPQEEVEKLMARILELQQPERAAHFLKEAKQDSSRAPKFEAQIMSFAV